MKSNKEVFIDYILKELNKGTADASKLSAKFCQKFQKSDRTFQTYWKIAKDRHFDDVRTVQDARAEQLAVEAKESVKRDILTKLDRMEIATKIARGISRKVGDQLIIPNDGDRLRALDYLSKLEGDYIDTEKPIDINISFDLDGFELVSDKL
jgi:hypothetical protein